jgi:transcriptional regulator with XRE-family HTH domain
VFDIGNRITGLRKQQDITQERFSSLLGMTRENLNRIEKNKVVPTLTTILKICEISNITISEFFSSDTSDLSPDLQRWLEAGKHLTPEQRKLLVEIIDKK